MSGNRYISFNEYIDLSLSPCDSAYSDWATHDDLNTVINNLELRLILRDKYFDFNDLDTPVKNFVKELSLEFRNDTYLFVTVTVK